MADDLSQYSDAELEALATQQAASGMSDDELAALAGQQHSPARQALDYGLRGLGYLGGAARTGAAMAASVSPLYNAIQKYLGNEKPLVDQDAMQRTLEGHAPTTDEYLTRAGMKGTGGSLSDLPGLNKLFTDSDQEANDWLKFKRGGPADLTTKGTLGFVGDTLIDPLTYAKAGKAVLGSPALGKILDYAANPLEKGLKATGTYMYKTAPVMKAADYVSERFKKNPISDYLMEKGVWGTAKKIDVKAQNLAEKADNYRKTILELADAKGGRMDMDAAMQLAQEKINAMKASRDPALQGVADQMQAVVNEYKGLGAKPAGTTTRQVPSADLIGNDGKPLMVTETIPTPAVEAPTTSQGAGFKSSIYNKIGDAAYDQAKNTQAGKAVQKRIAAGLNEEAARSAERVHPGLGKTMRDVNDELGGLLTTHKVINNEAKKEFNKNFWTAVDSIVASGGFLTPGHTFDPHALAIKKATDISKGNAFRTGGGLGLRKLSQTPLLDDIIRQEAAKQGY